MSNSDYLRSWGWDQDLHDYWFYPSDPSVTWSETAALVEQQRRERLWAELSRDPLWLSRALTHLPAKWKDHWEQLQKEPGQ